MSTVKLLEIVFSMGLREVDTVTLLVSNDYCIREFHYKNSPTKISLIYDINTYEAYLCGINPMEKKQLRVGENNQWTVGGMKTKTLITKSSPDEIHTTEIANNPLIDQQLGNEKPYFHERQHVFKRSNLLDKYLGRVEHCEMLPFPYRTDDFGNKFRLYNITSISSFGNSSRRSIFSISEIDMDRQAYLSTLSVVKEIDNGDL